MNTQSDFELTEDEKRQLQELLEKLWAYLNDVAEKNEKAIFEIPNYMERFRCVDKLLTWIRYGANIDGS